MSKRYLLSVVEVVTIKWQLYTRLKSIEWGWIYPKWRKAPWDESPHKFSAKLEHVRTCGSRFFMSHIFAYLSIEGGRFEGCSEEQTSKSHWEEHTHKIGQIGVCMHAWQLFQCHSCFSQLLLTGAYEKYEKLLLPKTIDSIKIPLHFNSVQFQFNTIKHNIPLKFNNILISDLLSHY